MRTERESLQAPQHGESVGHAGAALGGRGAHELGLVPAQAAEEGRQGIGLKNSKF